jgi:hypothetical protein
VTILDQYVEQAIPHEAGHILVGRILGLPVFWLEHFVKRGRNNELLPGDFATKVLAPTPANVPYLPKDVREALMFQIAGGLSGNIVSGVAADEHGIENDRERLKVISNARLEEVAESAKLVIKQHLEVFENLRKAIRDSYIELVKDQNLSAGCHQLLSGEQLDQICPQNRTRFPMLFR